MIAADTLIDGYASMVSRSYVSIAERLAAPPEQRHTEEATVATKTVGWTKGNNPGNGICYECKKVTWVSKLECTVRGTGGRVEGLCPDCYYKAGLENEHMDGNHTDYCPDGCPLANQ